MSRAFVTEGDNWTYCGKAGERCMHAEAGKTCKKVDCPHFNKTVPSDMGTMTRGDRIVKREKRR
ncbi:MAG: hypothetical protein MJ161_05250 [Clostridia bacterium]|nr:hypothetical protein [Clostridia bacterium]